MSHRFEPSIHSPLRHTVRRSLLVKANSERWADLLQSVVSEWDVTWVLDDEQFAIELAQGKFCVAAYEPAFSSSNSGDGLNPQLGYPAPADARPALRDHETQFLLLRSDAEYRDPQFSNPASGQSFPIEIQLATSRSEFQRCLEFAYRLSQSQSENAVLRRRLMHRSSPLVGSSPPIERLREQIEAAAREDWPVLIHGEPGTGRDLVARAIYDASERSHRPFIKIDCRLHSSTSLVRELFGQTSEFIQDTAAASFVPFRPFLESDVQGTSNVSGRIEQADGGVLLIDGIDEVAAPLQAVLAQVLERKCFQRIGERHDSPLNVRFIAVTSKDLFALCRAGQFRSDLLRHFVGPVVRTPALREIRSDLAPLTEHLLQRISARLGFGPVRLFVDFVNRLQAHNWPGNVCELEALLERVCSLDPQGKLTAESLETWLSDPATTTESRLPGLTLAQMERQLIEATFARCAGNRELTANTLQIGLRTLSGKLREYGYPPRGGPGSNRQQLERDAA